MTNKGDGICCFLAKRTISKIVLKSKEVVLSKKNFFESYLISNSKQKFILIPPSDMATVPIIQMQNLQIIQKLISKVQ